MGMNDFSREDNMQKIFEDRDTIEEEEEEEEERKEDSIIEKAEALINNHNDNNNSNHTEEKVNFYCPSLKSKYQAVNFILNEELRKISHQRTKQNIVRKIGTGVWDYLCSDYNQIEKKNTERERGHLERI